MRRTYISRVKRDTPDTPRSKSLHQYADEPRSSVIQAYNIGSSSLIVLGAGVECDCYQIEDVMDRAENEEQKN